MTRISLNAAAFAAVPILATLGSQAFLANPAFARGPAPLIPTALVEDIKSSATDVEFMDYVGNGQVIKLAPSDVLVLSYLKSCQHETITGGTVKIGAERSEVDGGKIARGKVPCDDGKIKLTSQQANASAATAFRLQSVAVRPVLYATPPMVQVPKLAPGDDHTLVIERVNKPDERQEIKVGEGFAQGGFLDLANTDIKPLTRGGVYTATIAGRKQTFMIDAKAKLVGKTAGKKAKTPPIISRLLRFTSG
jgi:hypothetical protein